MWICENKVVKIKKREAKTMKIKNSLFILLAGIFWGSMGIFVHLLTDYFGFSSLQAACLRIMSGVIIMFIFLAIKDKSLLKITPKDLPLLASNGVFSVFLMLWAFSSYAR